MAHVFEKSRPEAVKKQMGLHGAQPTTRRPTQSPLNCTLLGVSRPVESPTPVALGQRRASSSKRMSRSQCVVRVWILKICARPSQVWQSELHFADLRRPGRRSAEESRVLGPASPSAPEGRSGKTHSTERRRAVACLCAQQKHRGLHLYSKEGPWLWEQGVAVGHQARDGTVVARAKASSRQILTP